MKRFTFFLTILITLSALSCKSSSKTSKNEKSLQETLDERNRQTVTLLYRIQKLPGVTVRNGTPVFVKGTNSISSGVEPLYVLNDYVVGNSFQSVNELIESVNVKKIEILSSPDASFYGSRGGNGVIKITTYQ